MYPDTLPSLKGYAMAWKDRVELANRNRGWFSEEDRALIMRWTTDVVAEHAEKLSQLGLLSQEGRPTDTKLLALGAKFAYLVTSPPGRDLWPFAHTTSGRISEARKVLAQITTRVDELYKEAYPG